jgi:protease PrsW
MQLYILSFLVSIIFWLWIIMKYDKFEREPLRSILFVFIAGGLISSVSAGLLNHLFILISSHYFNYGTAENLITEKSLLFYGFVGINEELLKAAVTILLIRKMKNFNEPADALVYAMTVAFGFATFENIVYSLKFGFFVFFVRQFNAVPLHIGLAAIWGIGIAKAKFLHQGKYIYIIAPYVLIAAFVHTIYNISITHIPRSLITFIILSVFAFFLIRYAIRKIKRYAEDGPFSNRLFCHNCSTVNFPFERVCKKCGQKFDLEFYILCKNCNVKVIKNAPSCPKCGAELDR